MTEVTATPGAYSKARRKLGITAVGCIVVAAGAMLFCGTPSIIFGTSDVSTARWFANLLICVAAYEFASIPFDLYGFKIERAYRKTTESYGGYFIKWCMSAVKHGVLLMSSVFCFTFAARLGGLWAVVLSSLLIAIFFIWKQAELARFLSNVWFDEPTKSVLKTFKSNTIGPANLVIAHSNDRGFTGGIIGLPHAETVVIPARWLEKLTLEELSAEFARRSAAIESGSRTRGVLAACAFMVTGVGLSSFATIRLFGLALDSTAGIITTSLIVTLWSFIGLLVLPFYSQRGVFETDRLTVKNGVDEALLSKTIHIIDEDMENEPVRTNAIQFIFHPIPTPDRRVVALSDKSSKGAWHVARYAIWLSLIGMGLLGRAVHCNAGRPDLWCMLPAD